jgi:hypothetical protein
LDFSPQVLERREGWRRRRLGGLGREAAGGGERAGREQRGTEGSNYKFMLKVIQCTQGYYVPKTS